MDDALTLTGRAPDDLLRLLGWLVAEDPQEYLRQVLRPGVYSAYQLEELLSAVLVRLRALQEHYREQLRYRTNSGLALNGPDEGGRLLWVTRVFVDALKTLGEVGRVHAESIVQSESAAWQRSTIASHGAEPWRFWLDEQGRAGTYEFLHYLAASLWFDIVEPSLANRPRAKTPAISSAVLTKIVDAFWRNDRQLALLDGRQAVMRRGRRVAWVDSPGISGEVLPAARTLPSHRLFRFLIGEGYRQRLVGLSDYRRVTLHGGFSSLAAQLGMKGAKAAAQLREAMGVFEAFRLDLPGETSGCLLTWESKLGAPGRPSELRVVLGAPLLPEYVNSIEGRGLDERVARQLVPIPARLPPLVAHPQSHASQAVLQLLVLRHLRLNAAELVLRGAVAITHEAWLRLAEDADLPARLLPQVLEGWSAVGPAAFLLRDGDRFTLADSFSDELVTLQEGGNQQTEGRARQARSRRGRR